MAYHQGCIHTNAANILLQKEKNGVGDSLAVQCLGLCASTAGGMGLIPGQGTKILRAVQHSQKKNKEGRMREKEKKERETKKEKRKRERE